MIQLPKIQKKKKLKLGLVISTSADLVAKKMKTELWKHV